MFMAIFYTLGIKMGCCPTETLYFRENKTMPMEFLDNITHPDKNVVLLDEKKKNFNVLW